MIAIKGGVWGREIDPDAEARSHIAAVTERMMDLAAPEMHREVGRQMTLAAPPGAAEAALLEHERGHPRERWTTTTPHGASHTLGRGEAPGASGATRRALRDPRTTALILVLTPERLPILETRRAMDALAAFELPVRGLVADRVLPDEAEGVFLARSKQGERRTSNRSRRPCRRCRGSTFPSWPRSSRASPRSTASPPILHGSSSLPLFRADRRVQVRLVPPLETPLRVVSVLVCN
jgi:hypothetical protein